ncbi:F-box domain containing protein [Pandoravirus dulcis]|uniref:F-box domain containing protein n=1 Tax=Pandoravirus dulcis TaxID=1349409 RepID=S4VQH9_9VIRU|nr:F-box domain containing protein [Pandoravirus dulcis]AGO82608.1 F-box domain containing protein [Pandoravirus dulcis]
MAFEALPHEMWVHIFAYCDAVDVSRSARTCRAGARAALDPVHVLMPGYRRAAARLCTGRACLAHSGAAVDDDFFEAAERAPLGVVRYDDCRRADIAPTDTPRAILKGRALNGIGWYRVGARRLMETAPTVSADRASTPPFCHLPPSLVHSIGPLAAWALVDAAAQARHATVHIENARRRGDWLAGDGVRGPGLLCALLHGGAIRQWTWGFWRDGHRVGPGVVVTDAAPKDARSASVVDIEWKWAARWNSAGVPEGPSVARSIAVHAPAPGRVRETRHEVHLVDAYGRRCALVCVVDASGSLVGSLLRLCAVRPAFESWDASACIDRPWSAGQHLDRLWVVEVDSDGAMRETVTVDGDVLALNRPRPSVDPAWVPCAPMGPRATRVIDTARTDRPDSCPLVIVRQTDQHRAHVAVFASSAVAYGRGLCMDMIDLRDDRWMEGCMDPPVYSGTAAVDGFKSLVAYGRGYVCALLGHADVLVVLDGLFVCGAPADNCRFAPAHDCLVDPARWHWRYDDALGAGVLSPCGRATVQLASGIEMTCEWGAHDAKPRVTHIGRVTARPSAPRRSAAPSESTREKDVVIAGVTLLDPLDPAALDSLRARWLRRIPNVDPPFLRDHNGSPVHAAHMITGMLAQSALRFRVDIVGGDPVTVDFAAEDKDAGGRDSLIRADAGPGPDAKE